MSLHLHRRIHEPCSAYAPPTSVQHRILSPRARTTILEQTPTPISVSQQRTGLLAALPHGPDEWILNAVARLPGIDNPIPECHRRILDRRLDAWERGEACAVSMADARKRLL